MWLVPRRGSGAPPVLSRLRRTVPALDPRCFPRQTVIIGLVAFEQDHAAIRRDRVEDDGEAGACLVRIGAADPGPGRMFAACAPFDGVGYEHGIVGHVLEA